jgi:hypothetical protein
MKELCKLAIKGETLRMLLMYNLAKEQVKTRRKISRIRS